MKKEIVARLLKDGHINFDEALELMDRVQQVMQPYIPINMPLAPYNPAPNPFTQPGYPSWQFPSITCSNNFDGKPINFNIVGYKN